MADEKRATEDIEPERHSGSGSHAVVYTDRPAGWMYKGFRIGGQELWYASPKVQLFVVSMVCFMCPGMFNALGGLGGGGTVDPSANSIANVALYSVFAVVGFFAGTFANRLGIRITMCLGGIGYAVYASAFLASNHLHESNPSASNAFIIFAGCLLGVCAGLLWTAQGAIMMSYPPEHAKGRYISWFWIIFNTGAVVGSLAFLGQSVNDKEAQGATDGTYGALIALMTVGFIGSLCLCNADKVIRDDGSKVILMKNPSWQTEFKGLFETFVKEPWILLLFPMFFSSNIFYTYQNNGLNAAYFNFRSRALNGLLYWLAQIIGAVVFGFALDYPGLRRSVRAKISFVVLVVLTFVTWGGGYAWQKNQPKRAVVTGEDWEAVKIDWTEGSKYLGPMFLYFWYGFGDAAWQTCIYWYMGALSNSGRKAANFAGFYKGIQSAGAAIFWRLDDLGMEYETMFGVTWGLLAFSLLSAAPIILVRIKDSVSVEEDLKFSDETIEDVVVNPHAEKRTDH
jgi:MFS family permease